MVLCNQDKVIVPGVGEYIDEFWHTHILHTWDYQRDSRVLECFIHHNPDPFSHLGTSDDFDATLALIREAVEEEIETTRRLYHEYFGEPAPAEFW